MQTPLSRTQKVLEWSFAIAVVASLVYSAFFFRAYGYLPQPFFYDVGDTWMDWFNPAYWAHQPGTYDTYMTIYPPLSYLILKVITWGPCYVGAEGGWSRECDTFGIISLHLSWFSCVIVTFLTLRRVDRRNWLPRSIALSFGLPMLWGLDRGNLVLIAYVFVVLGFGPLIRSARLRWLFVGLAVNLKVYLIGTVVAQLLHRRWRWFEGALLSVIAVYVGSLALFGEGTPAVIYRNIAAFAESAEINNPLDLWMASSLLPLELLTKSQKFIPTIYLSSSIVDTAAFVIPLVTKFCQLTIMLAALAIFVRPNVAPRFRLLTLSIGFALMSNEASGYTETLVIIFVFMERFVGFGRRMAILFAYIVCIPADIPIDRLPPAVYEGFLSGRPVIVEYVVQVGPFVRPFMYLLMPVALAFVTLRTFVLAMLAERRSYVAGKAEPQPASVAT